MPEFPSHGTEGRMRGSINSSRKTCHSATLCRSGEFASQWRSSPTDKHSAWKANPACEAAQAKGGQDPALLARPARPGGDTHVQRQMASLGVVTAPRSCCVRGNIPNRTNTSTQPRHVGRGLFPGNCPLLYARHQGALRALCG